MEQQVTTNTTKSQNIEPKIQENNVQKTQQSNVEIESTVENNVQETQQSNVEIESIVDFTFGHLTDAGLHFGHKVKRANRKMLPYIYGTKDGIHVINLGKTIPLLKIALNAIRKAVSKNGRILFVGTQHQSKQAVKTAAQQCGQYFVSKKWLGGLLTNWKTVSKSIRYMKEIEKKLADNFYENHTKHEKLKIQRKYDKLSELFEGIREMNGLPNLIVVTSYHELTAIKEAKILNIPIVLLLDTDGDPQGIDFPVPGNDDSSVAVDLFCTLCSRACLLGIHDEQQILKRKEEEKQNKQAESKKDTNNQQTKTDDK